MDWSPDGEWIVHQSVVHFGTGAGITGESVWAAALDGSEVRYLYSTQRQQSLAGWMDPSRIVIYEWGQPYGAMNVLRVSLEGGQPFKVYDGPLGPTWVFDLEQGIVVFQLTKYEVQQDQPPGIYLSSIQSFDMSQLVLPGEWGGISYWDQGGLFLAVGVGGEIVGFDREGEIKLQIEISDGMGWTVPSPKNNMFAVYSDQGAWLYDANGGLIRQVMKGEVQQFIWGSNGTTFFVLVGENNTLLVGDSSTGDLAMIESGVRELKLIG
jgi:hypothetical protein